MSMFLKGEAKKLSIKMADVPGAPKLKTTEIFNFDSVPAPDYWETSTDPTDLEDISPGSDDVFSDGSSPPPTPSFLDSESTESDIETSSEDSSSETSEEDSEDETSEEIVESQENSSDTESATSGFSPGPQDDDPDSQKLPESFGSMFAFATSNKPSHTPENSQGVKRKPSERDDGHSKKKPEIIVISSDDEEDDDIQYVKSFTVQGTPPHWF